jgi:hypothetical protein
VPPRAGHRARRVSARLPLSSEYRTIDPTPHPLRRGRLSVHVMPPQRGPMRVACANLPEKPARDISHVLQRRPAGGHSPLPYMPL